MKLLYLVGGRASGKSTLGRALAKGHAYAFIDLDNLICESLGQSVAEIVARAGWAGFRDEESLFLRLATRQLAESDSAVVACGGGIIEREENIDFMRANGFVLWLCPPVEAQARRLAADPAPGLRPSLTGAGALEELAATMEKRRSLYERAAHARLASTGAPEDICRQIVSLHHRKVANRH